jgi:hypothetical protein
MEEGKSEFTSAWKNKLKAIKNMVMDKYVNTANNNNDKKQKENQVTPVSESVVKKDKDRNVVSQLGRRGQAVDPVEDDTEDLETGTRMVANNN